MEFISPRFRGNAHLEEILNDPNTGTKKLAKGSPADAVRAVQQALLDLHWVPLSFTSPGGTLSLITQFLDGDYGPWTAASVLDYKRHYDIHFPPDAPTGSFDGFTGPGTLKKLDEHCTLLDEAQADIGRQADILVASGAVSAFEFSPPDGVGRTTSPIRQSAGASRAAVIDGEVGAVVFKRGLGSFAIHGPLFVGWVTEELALGTGDATGRLGFPTSGMATSETTTSFDVERGRISHDAVSNEVSVEVDPTLAVSRQALEF